MLDKVKENYQIIISIVAAIIIASMLFGVSYKEKNFSAEQNLGQNDNFTSFKLEGWGSAWYTQPEYDGDDMPNNALVKAENIDFDIKKSIAPRLGNEILGTESSTKNPINTMHTSNALDGRELLLRTHSTVIEWWNADDENWDQLDDGYTTGQDFSFVDGMTSSETANYTYFTNGKESLRRFRIAFGSLSTTTGATTTLNSVTGYDSVDDIGFNTSGTVTIDGTDYSYTGINGWNLTGMTAVPTSLSENEGIISTVETSGFTDSPASSTALVIKDQRLYAAYNNSVFCSKIDDFQDFSYSSPRVASEGEVVIFPEGGDSILGLAVRPNYVAVFKKNYIGSLKFEDFGTDLSDIPVVNTLVSEIDIGAVNQKSIVNKNFSVIFANNDLGLSELTQLENKNFDETISLAERVRNSVEDYVLTDSTIGIYRNKVLHSVRDDSDFNNKIIVYDFLYDRFTEFSGWNALSFAVYNDNLYYGDAINQNVYKAFTGEYNDNDLPYTTEWKTKWVNFGYPDNWKEIGYVFVEGFITQNTSLDFTINLDEGGDLTAKTITISGDGDYVAELPAAGFGINPFGLTNFGDITGDTETLRHFAGYILLDDLFGNKFRNIQFQGKTSGTGQNYRITKIIPYVNILEVQWAQGYSEFIIND
jgi:hypothetical protein